MWFASWGRLGLLVASALLAYLTVIGTLRVSGKRTLSKLNAFDLVVTVALGSVLATVVVSREVPVAEGVLALTVLVLLQFAVAWMAQRSDTVRSAVTASPTALVAHGRVRHDALERCRVTQEEVAASVRSAGLGSFADVDLVILESDGTLTVITQRGNGSALTDVEGAA